jgi:hypothetical protein
MTTALLPAVLLLSLSDPKATLEAVVNEGRLLRGHPIWRENERAVLGTLLAHQKEHSGYEGHAAPPSPSIAELGLPLSFLATCLVDDCPNAHRGSLDEYSLPDLYLDAIARVADPRKAAVLLAYGDSADDRLQLKAYRLLGKHTTPEQAEAILESRLLSTPTEKRTDLLVKAIAQSQAEKLRGAARKLTYDHLLSTAPDGPSNGDPEHTWELLFRVDGPRARQDIISRLNEQEINYAIRVVMKHPGPSKALAMALRKYKPNTPGMKRACWWHASVVSDNDLARDLEQHVVSMLSQVGKDLDDPIYKELWTLITRLLDQYEGPRAFSIRKRLIESPKIGWDDCLSVLRPMARRSDPRVPALARFCAKKGAPDIVSKRLRDWGYQAGTGRPGK